MAFQANIKLPLPSAFPCLCTLLVIFSLLSCSHAQSSCKCPGSSDQDDWNMNNTTTFDKIAGYMYRTNDTTGGVQYLPQSLGYYMKNPSDLNDLSDSGMFIMGPARSGSWEYNYMPFRIVFNMSLYQPKEVSGGSLILAIFPDIIYNDLMDSRAPVPLINSSFNSTANDSAQLAGNSIHFRTGVLYSWAYNISCVQIAIEPTAEAGDSAVSADYRISIDYNPLGSMSILVQVDADGQPYSGDTVNVNLSIDVMRSSHFGVFGFSSSLGQLLQLHTWNWTVPNPILWWAYPPGEDYPQGKKGASTTIIVSSVVGSAVATAVMDAVAYWYFNSKYRGWKKDLDQLAKSMQQLPGVPTQFDFADIRRATNNFHETMRLGQGGFGTVYRCRLRPPKRVEAMVVAVKKFSRDDNRRYEDFLAEVSVINRLRHRNIVPLLGWSYHKGEPLLIYEFMPNGSLDQHLFPRNSSSMQQQQATPIHQWSTRYNMVKDIATGLHYVHHEYEPMVLHRDIKAGNVMIDSTFQARLGDFGLACVVANGKNSYTDLDAPGTIGFMAPEYLHSCKATTKSDIFAFGVIVLEIITGKRAVKNPQFSHITDWVWQHHKEDKLLEAVDPILRSNEEFEAGDAKRLLLLGLACSNPRPSDRPTMVEAVQIITRSARPPEVPLEIPRFLWPPPEEEGCSLSSDYSTELSNLDRGLNMQVEMAAGGGQASSSSGNGGSSLHRSPIGGPSQEVSSIYHTAPVSHRRAFTQEFSS